MPARRPKLMLLPPEASAEEAAAIVAAIERFMRATARVQAPAGQAPDRWRRVAILEGTLRGHEEDVPDLWINT